MPEGTNVVSPEEPVIVNPLEEQNNPLTGDNPAPEESHAGPVDPFAGVKDVGVTQEQEGELQQYLERIVEKYREDPDKLLKLWRKNSRVGIGTVKFREACKLFNWVPEGLSE